MKQKLKAKEGHWENQGHGFEIAHKIVTLNAK